MILFRDNLKLSLTKLKIRVPRLIITVIVASLLFSACIFIMVAVKGAINSLQSFNSEGLSNRYLVIGNNAVYINYESDLVVIKAVEDAFTEHVRLKTAEAKIMGIEYYPKSEQPWVEVSPENQKYIIGYNHPRVRSIIEDFASKNLNYNYDKFREANGAIDTFRASEEYFGGPYGPQSDGSQLEVIKDSKENFKLSNSSEMVDYFSTKGFATIEDNNLRAVDKTLLQPFALPGQSLVYDGSAIPSLVPFSVAEEALGLIPLKDSASAEQKLTRLQQVRKDIAGKTLTVCYRNGSSAQDIQKVLLQQQDLELNKNKKDYNKPSIVYDLPKTPCGPIEIKSDSRNIDQKKQDSNQNEFDLKFGKQEPISKLQNIKIVGILPDRMDQYSSTITGILTSVVSSSIGTGWITTIEVAQLPEMKGIVASVDNLLLQNIRFIAELPDSEAQKKFITEQSCNVEEDNFIHSPMSMTGGFMTNPSEQCNNQGKYYVFRSFGNNASAISDLEKGFNKAFKIVILIITVLSGIILMGIMARIIADGRRETAVFRAIGATKLDIGSIYTLYALIISSFVAMSALIIGFVLAVLFNNHYGQQFTTDALLIFNSTDMNKHFNFIGIDQEKLLQVVAFIFISGLLGLLLPLITNLKRSPIKDMRDEN